MACATTRPGHDRAVIPIVAKMALFVAAKPCLTLLDKHLG